MNLQTLRVAIDVGNACHRVAVGLPNGALIDEFDVEHHSKGFAHSISISFVRYFPLSVT